MFYEQLLLARKGALGSVWMAVHLDKKLTKQQIKSTNIVTVANYISDPIAPGKSGQPEGAQMALRLSGHLLLGVVKIYSRQVSFLYTDCSEALVKIRMAFRPGAHVDLEESVANLNTITLPDTIGEYEINLPDIPVADIDLSIDGLDLNRIRSKRLISLERPSRSRNIQTFDENAGLMSRDIRDDIRMRIDDVARAGADEMSRDSDYAMDQGAPMLMEDDLVGVAPYLDEMPAPEIDRDALGGYAGAPEEIPELDISRRSQEILEAAEVGSSFSSLPQLEEPQQPRAAKRKTRAFVDASTRIPDRELMANIKNKDFATKDLERGPSRKRAKRAELPDDIAKLVNRFPFFVPPAEAEADDRAREATRHKRGAEEMEPGALEELEVGPIAPPSPTYELGMEPHMDQEMLELPPPEEGFEGELEELPQIEEGLEEAPAPLDEAEKHTRIAQRDAAISDSINETTEQMRRFLGAQMTGNEARFSDLFAGQKRSNVAFDFYQLLALSSKRSIKLSQSEPYGEITITKTDRFEVPVVAH